MIVSVLELLTSMGEGFIILMIASFFACIYAIADQIRRINNEEIKQLFKKTTDAHLASVGVFDMPPLAVLGVIISSFYTLYMILKLSLQGRLRYLIQAISKEKVFFKRFIIIILFWLLGTALTYHKRFIENIILVVLIVVMVTINIVISKVRESYK